MSVLKYKLIVDYLNENVIFNEPLTAYHSKFSKSIRRGFMSETKPRAANVLKKLRLVNLHLGFPNKLRLVRMEALKAQAIEALEWVVNNHATVRRFVRGSYSKRWIENNPLAWVIYQANRRCLAEEMTVEEEENYANLVEIRDNATALFGYAWHIDHVIPVSKGGTNSINNLEVVPASWNVAKLNRNSDSFWG